MSFKYTDKKDKQSHHKNNFLVLFSKGNHTSKRAIVNASDSLDALRIAIKRLARYYPEEDITRARIGGIYPNERKRIEKRIG